jgi:hypothetical protein
MASEVEYLIMRMQDALYYRDVLLLKYDIQYPQFYMDGMPVACLNQRYAAKAAAYAQYCRDTLFRQAKEQYEEDQQIDAPVRVFDAVTTFTVTLNENCTLSLYSDRYEYTGGAHGNTVRTSDTWDVPACAHIPLSALCTLPAGCRAYVIQQIVRQIEMQIAEGEYYFDDYRKNTALYFNPRSFYLTHDGLTVYYQQYEIAPYSSGIPEFSIPYSTKIRKPDCTA